MTVYMVERNLKGIALSDLAAAQKSAIGTANSYAAKGWPIRYVRSTFAPEDGRCMCLFEANSAEDGKRLQRRSQASLFTGCRGARSGRPEGMKHQGASRDGDRAILRRGERDEHDVWYREISLASPGAGKRAREALRHRNGGRKPAT